MHRIRLGNTEFEGRNNAYLFDGEGPTVLVDTGVDTDAVREQLARGLAARDVVLADVDAVVLTHWHPDHAGQAGRVKEASGATVYVHEADAPLVTGNPSAELYDLHERRFSEWAVPKAKQEEVRSVAEASDELVADLRDVEPIEEGDTICAGEATLRVLHTPGHTAGHSSFVVEGTRTALAGDAVLPVYTPNIGGADLRVERPLATYRESLSRFSEAAFDRLYPGHRDAIDDPDGRISAILNHHRERTRRVVDVLAEHGPATAWEVSTHLFGELEGVHVLHGPGEAFAHLAELEVRGDVERSGTEYRLPSAPDADEAS